jgi:outer membrane protein insertion porin family
MILAVFLAVQTPQAAQTVPPNYIEAVDVRGNKVPTATIKNQLRTKKGDLRDQSTIDRDLKTLYSFNGGLFDDVKALEEPGIQGGIVIVFQVVEKKRIDKIEYVGLNTYTKSDINDKLHEKKISLGRDTKYDPTVVARAVAMIKVLLAEKGHQDATVEVTKEDLTASSVSLTFRINEGPKIRIQDIQITGNKAFSEKKLLSQMKLVKPASPLTPFTSKDTYHALKLGDDITRIRMFYSDNGFARINVLDPTVETKPVNIYHTIPFWKPLFPWGIPVPFANRDVSRLFVGIQVEENDQYRINNVKVLGVKTPVEEVLVKQIIGFKKGDLYSEGQLRKGFENLKKFYGSGGFINFNPDPSFDFNEENKTVDLTINVDTGKSYSIRRINFYGNTTTRDKVIRRELNLMEGSLFDSNRLRQDLLRINQLGFFDEIKEEDAHVDPNDTASSNDKSSTGEKPSTVDINIKVAEKGKNTIGLSGGASAVGGSFIGVNYSTNNFLGYGETISADAQAGTRQSNFIFSITEPYFRDRPLAVGGSVQATTYHYDQARDSFGLDPNNLPQGLGLENRLFYNQRQNGFSVYTSYPLRVFNRFARVGLTYQFTNSETSAINPATQAYFEAVNAQQGSTFVSTVGSGFGTFHARKISPSFVYSTVDSPNFPTNGHSFSASLELTGGPLGGNVNMIRPVFEYRFYKPSTKRRNVIAMRIMGSNVRGFGGLTVPFYERFQIGGEYDIRGFENRQLSPISFVTTLVPAIDPETGGTAKRPFDDIAYVGGDTQGVMNLEYRIRIIGPVTVSPFFDLGNTWVTRKQELSRTFLDTDNVITTETAHFLSGTNSGLRASTGVELGVILPMFNVPFRLIFGTNPLRLDRQVYGPTTGMPFQLKQRGTIMKFSIGRTF